MLPILFPLQNQWVANRGGQNKHHKHNINIEKHSRSGKFDLPQYFFHSRKVITEAKKIIDKWQSERSCEELRSSQHHGKGGTAVRDAPGASTPPTTPRHITLGLLVKNFGVFWPNEPGFNDELSTRKEIPTMFFFLPTFFSNKQRSRTL